MDAVSPPGPARRRGWWAWFALLLSAGFHAWLLVRLPVFLSVSRLEQPLFPDYPAIALDRVERQVRPPTAAPDRFRPEHPGQVEALWSEIVAEPEVPAPVNLPVPELPDVSTGPRSGEAEALAEPSRNVTPLLAWDPRQDVLQIEQPVLDDRAAALPRRWTATAPRSDRVPDIVLPIEEAAGFVVQARAGLPAGIESSSRPTLAAVPGTGQPTGAGPANTAWTDLFSREQLPRLDEQAWAPEERAIQPVEDYLRMSVRRFAPTDEPDAIYVELVLARDREHALPVLPKDVLFVQDCSESMTPWKLSECKRGLVRCLDQLNPGDRFDVLAFRDTTTRCFGEWRTYDPASKAAALAFIDGLRAQGNTDVYASLQAALSVPRAAGRPVIMALVSDGRPTIGETASSSIIEGFTRANQGQISVFSLGGGQRVNRFLLDLLSYRNRGDVLVEPEMDRIPYAMERWAAETRRPVLSDLSYRFSGVDQADVYPGTLTHLYLDRPLTLYARLPAGSGAMAFQIVGRSGDRVYDLVLPLRLDEAQPGRDDIRTRWVWHRIYEWIGRYLGAPGEADRSRIQALADRYGLAVPYGFGTAVPRW